MYSLDFFKIYLFIFFFWMKWVFGAAHRLSLGCGEWVLLFVVVQELLMRWLFLLQSIHWF